MDQRMHILDSVYKELRIDLSASKAKPYQNLTVNETLFFDEFQKILDTVCTPEYEEVIEYLNEEELADYYERIKEFVNLLSERVETKAKALMNVPLVVNFTSIIQATEGKEDPVNGGDATSDKEAAARWRDGITLKTNIDNRKEINGNEGSAVLHYYFRKKVDDKVWIGDRAFEKIKKALPQILVDSINAKIPDAKEVSLVDILKAISGVELQPVIFHIGWTGMKVFDVHIGETEVLIHFNLFIKDGFWDITDGYWWYGDNPPEADTKGNEYELLLGKPYAYDTRDGIISIPRTDWNALDNARKLQQSQSIKIKLLE